VPSGRPSKKRQRAERREAARQETSTGGSTPPAGAAKPEGIAPADLFARLGFRWTSFAGILLAIFFFWTWLFLDFDPDGADPLPGRGQVWLMVFSPEIWTGFWFGNVGSGAQPAGFWDRMPVVGTAVLIVLASFGPGSLLVTLLLRRGSLDRLEHVVLGTGAGLNLASLAVLAGGMSMPGALHDPWWIWFSLLIGLLLLPGAIWIVVVREGTLATSDAIAPAATDETNRDHVQPPTTRWGSWSGWLIGLLSIPYVLGGVLPPWDFDVREYHLQAPKEWMQRGQIEFLPHNVYANMPLGVETHALTATAIMGGDDGWWFGGLTAKLIVSLFGPLTALLLWSIGRRSGYPAAGTFAAICYLSLPWIAHVSLNGLNDAVLGFYLLAAWWVWLRSEAGDWRALVLAGFFAGAASAVKYPALIFGVLPLMVETVLRQLGLRGARKVPYVGLRQLRSAIAGVVLLSLGLLAGGGLWYVKNKMQTGNPVYPLLASRLDGASRTPEKDARWVQAHAVPKDSAGRRFTIAQFATGLANLAFRDKYASPLLVPLAIMGCVVAVRRWWKEPSPTNPLFRFPLLAIGLFAFHFGAWYLLTHRIDRFLVPALPLLALLAGYGYVYAKEQAGSTIPRAFAAVGLIYCWMMIAGSFLMADVRWFVSLAHLRADPAAETSRPDEPTLQRLTPAERWLNAHLAGDDAVLMVGGAQVWDLNGKTKKLNVYYNTCFDDCLLLEWRGGKRKTAEEFRSEFTQRNVKYVCIDWEELARYLSPGNYGYDSRLKAETSLSLIQNFEKVKIFRREVEFGEVSSRWGVFTEQPRRPRQVIYRVLTSAEAKAAAEAERRDAAKRNATPTPKAAPPASANQSRTSGER
jgi:hypothetical protein